MLETQKRKPGRPAKDGERVESVGLSLLPSRTSDLDRLVRVLGQKSRGELVTYWIERELKSLDQKVSAA